MKIFFRKNLLELPISDQERQLQKILVKYFFLLLRTNHSLQNQKLLKWYFSFVRLRIISNNKIMINNIFRRLFVFLNSSNNIHFLLQQKKLFILNTTTAFSTIFMLFKIVYKLSVADSLSPFYYRLKTFFLPPSTHYICLARIRILIVPIFIVGGVATI